LQEQSGADPFTVDVGIRGADGRLRAGYKLKDIQRIAGVKPSLFKALEQLKAAPAPLRVVLADVHQPSTSMPADLIALFTVHASYLGTTVHVRFSDGHDLTLPPRAAVYPPKE
jgi:hypothetical protein